MPPGNETPSFPATLRNASTRPIFFLSLHPLSNVYPSLFSKASPNSAHQAPKSPQRAAPQPPRSLRGAPLRPMKYPKLDIGTPNTGRRFFPRRSGERPKAVPILNHVSVLKYIFFGQPNLLIVGVHENMLCTMLLSHPPASIKSYRFPPIYGNGEGAGEGGLGPPSLPLREGDPTPPSSPTPLSARRGDGRRWWTA